MLPSRPAKKLSEKITLWTKDAASIAADAFDTPGRVEEAVRLCALYQSER